MAIAGNLRDMSLVDIIQFICRNKEESRITVENNGEEGCVYLAKGRIVHAEYGQDAGKEALYHLLKWDEGQFQIEKEVATSTHSIQQPWTAVLMQAMQRIDEESQHSDQTQPSAESGDILKKLADRVSGFVAGYITNMEGETVFAESPADHATFGPDAAPEALFQVLAIVNHVLETVGAGRLQEIITLTERYRFITRYIEKDQICLQLVLTANGNLGAARMYLTAYELQDEV
jgi:hypothetical protein